MCSSSVWRLFVKIEEYSRYPVVDILSVSANAVILKWLATDFRQNSSLINRYQNITSGNPLLELTIQWFFFNWTSFSIAFTAHFALYLIGYRYLIKFTILGRIKDLVGTPTGMLLLVVCYEYTSDIRKGLTYTFLNYLFFFF